MDFQVQLCVQRIEKSQLSNENSSHKWPTKCFIFDREMGLVKHTLRSSISKKIIYQQNRQMFLNEKLRKIISPSDKERQK